MALLDLSGLPHESQKRLGEAALQDISSGHVSLRRRSAECSRSRPFVRRGGVKGGRQRRPPTEPLREFAMIH